LRQQRRCRATYTHRASSLSPERRRRLASILSTWAARGRFAAGSRERSRFEAK
jgi:hypothetical protein